MQNSWVLPRAKDFSPLESWRFLRFGPYDPSCTRFKKEQWQRLFWYQGKLSRLSFGASLSKIAAHLECKDESLVPELSEQLIVDCLGLGDQGKLIIDKDSPLKQVPRKVRQLGLVKVPWTYEGLISLILQQRVSWAEAASNWTKLCRKHGVAWGKLRSLPSPAILSSLSDANYAACGVEKARSGPCREAARLHHKRDKLDLSHKDWEARLLKIQGIGPWTTQYFLGLFRAHSDAVPTGDYDLPHLVSYVLEGERKGSDARMLELLKPFSGQRFRVLRWLLVSGIRVPRRGPRLPFGQGL